MVQTELRLAALAFTRLAQHGADVRFTVVNLGASTVRITTRCGDQLTPVVERRSGNEWQQYSGGFCITIYPMSPVPLSAGAQRDGVVVLAEPGKYRLILGTESGPVVSATFSIQ